MALADSVIGELHLLEQMSSDEHLGSLAEAVLEAVKGHAEAAKRVDQVSDLSRTCAIKKTLSWYCYFAIKEFGLRDCLARFLFYFYIVGGRGSG
jgi:hypothetical protein